MLLLLVLERPDHGYDLLERLTGLGVTGVDAGHLYRVLNGFERDGLLESSWVTSSAGPQRRRYELTAKGRAELDVWARRLAKLQCGVETWLDRWARAGQVTDGGPAPNGGQAPNGGPAPNGRPDAAPFSHGDEGELTWIRR